MQHNIVVVGGGAGGLELITRLGKKFGQNRNIKIQLVDCKATHVWKPLYHEIVADTLSVPDSECHFSQHALEHHYQFVQAKLSNIDTQNKQLLLEDVNSGHALPALHYDTIVLALGSVSNDFNTPGVQQHAYFLDQQQQAEQLQQLIANKINDLPCIGIVGAGATGVELAAQLKIRYPQIPVYVIEAASSVLPGYTAKMSQYAKQQLIQMGVQIYTDHRVLEVQPQQLVLDNNSFLRTDICIWTAGIKAPALFAQLTQFERDSIDRIKVNASLQSVSHHDVFAIGDCAHFMADGALQPLGARAQVASQQAEFLVKAIAARLAGKHLPHFKFLDKGTLINLNHLTAVGELFSKVPVQGAMAKTMYLSLYPLHLVNIHGVPKAGVLSSKDVLQRFMLPLFKKQS